MYGASVVMSSKLVQQAHHKEYVFDRQKFYLKELTVQDKSLQLERYP
jgi:hypothetical protein